ncbi:MAG: phosphopentomutase [Clostridiales bacterium]|nr:phosphopentomutase [Clostridiales bacterium]
MRKAVLIVLDSVGAGALPDAHLYGDVGANTLGHTVLVTGLRLPNMEKIGLGAIRTAFLPHSVHARGVSARLKELSPGKDTTTGHWEMAGVRLSQAFPTFPDGFPEDFITRFETAIGRGTLGNYAASGTQIIEDLGEEHLKTGSPIVYTSADSVFQIAAHEEVIPPEELYQICQTAREMLTGELAVGRVIARPFVGNSREGFTRTGNRRDFSLTPPGNTILDDLKQAGFDVIGVGKIEDIFAHQGLTDSNHAAGNAACIQAALEYLEKPFDGLLFINLVDFDMLHGHRRDPEAYARALKDFDEALPRFQEALGPEDLLIITADHGCDPTFSGTDHTREYAPLLAWRPGLSGHSHLGDLETFSDIAATISDFFGLAERYGAHSFLRDLEDLA